MVLRSLTKYYALPGLRLGYLLGEAHRVAQLAAYQEPWSVNAPALSVALACLKDSGFTMKTARWLEWERKFLFERLEALEGFRPFASKTNFLLVKIERKAGDALRLRSFLIRRKILVRAGDSFAGVGDNYFRIAVKRRRDNRCLLRALEEWTTSSIGSFHG
jgi:threonine-phosphate decarboxylase